MKTAAWTTLVIGVAASSLVLGVGQPPTSPGKPPAAEAPAPRVKIDSLAFLAGNWIGTLEGGAAEETWSAARGDSIVGMFRWHHPDGSTNMYELLSIKQEGDAAVLRLRHFDSKFEPWKTEAAGVPALKGELLGPAHVIFRNGTEAGGLASCEYRCTSADVLAVTVSFKAATGREPLKFEFKRSK